ncbi:MAG TPA: DUF2752 domain-containing protein [Saprospiraceae bacterium]|nr:DUF2752 domain-containing protein [Saprospiraceae bacterium]
MKSKKIYWLLGGIVIIVLYGLYDPARYPFPPCPFRTLTGFMCPGCGSQRAIHQVLHGHFVESFRLNALFLPGILYGLIGFVVSNFYPVAWPGIRERFYGLNAAYFALGIIIIFWVVRNFI